MTARVGLATTTARGKNERKLYEPVAYRRDAAIPAGGVVRPTPRVHAFRSARQATIVDETSRPHRQSEPDINGSNS
jgi:hypothetical protein